MNMTMLFMAFQVLLPMHLACNGLSRCVNPETARAGQPAFRDQKAWWEGVVEPTNGLEPLTC